MKTDVGGCGANKDYIAFDFPISYRNLLEMINKDKNTLNLIKKT